MRVSVYYHAANPELAIRMCNKEIKSRAQLALPEAVDQFTRYPSGLVLVTGPTGSGKTTTLNYMIDLINSERRCKIITIEDPIEFVHERKKAIIVQQELYTDVKSFSSALIHVLRQNPDVICVGEMRDYETTATALIAAETGHLVIATLHTPNSLQTMERIMSVFPRHAAGAGHLANWPTACAGSSRSGWSPRPTRRAAFSPARCSSSTPPRAPTSATTSSTSSST